MIATRFQKKPIVIEAAHWPGGADTATPIIDWVRANGGIASWFPGESGAEHERILLDTLEGPVHASVGDWIIRGIAGEFYPCRDVIFLATYEPPTGPDLSTMES